MDGAGSSGTFWSVGSSWTGQVLESGMQPRFILCAFQRDGYGAYRWASVWRIFGVALLFLFPCSVWKSGKVFQGVQSFTSALDETIWTWCSKCILIRSWCRGQHSKQNPEARAGSVRHARRHKKVLSTSSILHNTYSVLTGRQLSVVFSSWTKTFDIIQPQLMAKYIRCVRLDGTLSASSRASVLSVFRTNPGIKVLLATITCGGVGLDLTAASRAYIMEPQWNPMSESQALDRIHRLGQKNEVKTTRYVIRRSWEENVLKLQRRKQDLADLTLSAGAINKDELTYSRLQYLKILVGWVWRCCVQFLPFLLTCDNLSGDKKRNVRSVFDAAAIPQRLFLPSLSERVNPLLASRWIKGRPPVNFLIRWILHAVARVYSSQFITVFIYTYSHLIGKLYEKNIYHLWSTVFFNEYRPLFFFENRLTNGFLSTSWLERGSLPKTK